MFPSKDLLFIHFDAHPDLAVPSTTAVEVCMSFEGLLNAKHSLSFTSRLKVQSFWTAFLCFTRCIFIDKKCFRKINWQNKFSVYAYVCIIIASEWIGLHYVIQNQTEYIVLNNNLLYNAYLPHESFHQFNYFTNSIIYWQDWHDLDKLHDVLSDDVCGISEFLLPLGP